MVLSEMHLLGALGLGERIEQFQATRSNEPVPVKRLAPGEFRGEREADTLSYEAHIPPRDSADVAHVSWLTTDYGVLMLADLLPEGITAGSIALGLSDGWSARSSEACDKTHHCLFGDPARQVYLVGRTQATSTATPGIEVSVSLW